ncbi:MAG: discoidin domain-containing protein [Planctomycetes bacterium]|nr:discoidin domain-containing protein [Planctomycetota bacterium]
MRPNIRQSVAAGWAGLALVAFGLAAAACGVRPALAEDPVITPAQIEADWLRQDELRRGAPGAAGQAGRVTPEQDAAGGCDGVRNGQWGFHTENEPDPWWQVDLGQAVPLDRVVLYNRCDGCAGRNARIMVLLSDDGKTWRQVYQHDGTTFLGHTDQKPLVVALKGEAARYLRLQLPGTSYFHLDEVEVYAVGGKDNVALAKPATQSSVSEWSASHRAGPEPAREYPTADVVARGLRLAASLGRMGADVADDVGRLEVAAARLKSLPADAPADARRRLYLDARWAVRGMALRNPLLDFDTVLFVKSAPGRFPHISDQFYGWWSRPGGGVFLLEGFKGGQPKMRCLTAAMPEGSFLRPDLSYDGRKVLFTYCRYYPHVADLPNKADKANVPEDAFNHIYEINVDGTGLRQLTRGRYDDFDARYLPGGEIVFVSTRKGQFVQCTAANTATTATADLPDSYVRCGGDNYRPVPVFTLHTMDSGGGNLRPISAFENFEWTPAVAGDGQILYSRWDYIDRFNGHFFSLWSTHPDGTNPQLVYGNYTTRPQAVLEARAIPNSHNLVFTASAHHSITGGSLVLFDRSRGTEGGDPIVRLTPEVPFPETEAWPESYYANPWALSEEYYLVAWSDRKLPPHCRVDNTDQNPLNAAGLYLYDAFGNLTLLYRDPAISANNPVPVRPRPRPPAYPSAIAWDGAQEGCFLLQDVYQGLAGVPRGSVKRLRVIGVPPKTQPHMNQPNLGVSAEDPGKFLLGTVPVEEDGSAYFRAPSGISVFFQAVDADGLALQTMRSLTYVWPGQTLSCIGCHESREAVPTAPAARPLAARRDPSKLACGPTGSWPLRYDQLVQPVLEKHCVSCHRPGSDNEKGARLDLTAAKSYDSLMTFGGKDLHQLVFERDRSVVGECAARRSKLLALLKDPKGHEGVRLDAESLQRLVIWMDLYAQRRGHFSDGQEEQLRELRKQLAALLAP